MAINIVSVQYNGGFFPDRMYVWPQHIAENESTG